MKPTKRKKQAAIAKAPATGRDGAIDLIGKRETFSPATEAGGEDHVYRVIEVVGTSKDSIEDAIDSAVHRASRTLRNLRWFEVVKTSGHIENGTVRHFQVTLKVGFTMENVR
jgi:flavin-binding protein dodecin